MNDSTRGLVSTPPKSEITTSIPASFSGISAHHLVVAQALAAFQRPAEEGDGGVEPLAVHGAGVDQAARAAHRLAFVVHPELQRRAALDAVGPVFGREQRLGDLDRGAVGVADDRNDLLGAVIAGA